MKMKEFCEATGLSRDTVNFYIKRGLISPSVRANTYRDFCQEDVDHVRRILEAKALGFALAEIKTISALYYKAQLDEHEKLGLLHKKLEHITQKRQELEELEHALRQEIEQLDALSR